MTTKTARLAAAIDAMIRARNEANETQQRFADYRAATEPDDVVDAMYESVYELIHRIDNLIDNPDLQSALLGLGIGGWRRRT